MLSFSKKVIIIKLESCENMTKKVNKKSKHLPLQESVNNLEPTKELYKKEKIY